MNSLISFIVQTFAGVVTFCVCLCLFTAIFALASAAALAAGALAIPGLSLFCAFTAFSHYDRKFFK